MRPASAPAYYLLFDVSALINVPQSYIMFTASQYDNYSYLFYAADVHQPEFELGRRPRSIPIAGHPHRRERRGGAASTRPTFR